MAKMKAKTYRIMSDTTFQSLQTLPQIIKILPKLTWMESYSSWGSIVSKSVFDWVCISFWKRWGSIQELGCIQLDTVVSFKGIYLKWPVCNILSSIGHTLHDFYIFFPYAYSCPKQKLQCHLEPTKMTSRLYGQY